MIKHLTPRSEEEIETYLAAVSLKDLIFGMDSNFMKKELCRRLHIVDIGMNGLRICAVNFIHSVVQYYTVIVHMRGYNRKYMYDALEKEDIHYEIEDEESDEYNDYTKNVYKIRMKIYK